MKYTLDDLSPGHDARCLIVEPDLSRGFLEYVATAMEVVKALYNWPGYTPVIYWPDGQGRNMFYQYFKLFLPEFVFYSVEDLPPGYEAELSADTLGRFELLAGLGDKDKHHRYVGYYEPRNSPISTVPGRKVGIRMHLVKSALGYYRSKFTGNCRVVGVDCRHLSPSELDGIAVTLDREILSRPGVRLFLSGDVQNEMDFLLERYGERVYVRRKDDEVELHRLLMECAILSRCDKIVGSAKSLVFTLARILSDEK